MGTFLFNHTSKIKYSTEAEKILFFFFFSICPYKETVSLENLSEVRLGKMRGEIYIFQATSTDFGRLLVRKNHPLIIVFYRAKQLGKSN